MSEHEHSIGFYVLILVALLILTGVTVGAAFVNLHAWNPVVALAIASLKAVLVCLLYTSPSPRDPKTSRMPSSA